MMFRNDKLTQSVLNSIARAERQTLEDLQQTRVEHEPSVTDRLIAYIQYELNGKTIGGVKWSAKTLTAQGPHTQERKFGADFMAVLNLNLDRYKVTKGFLAQAKRVEPSDKFHRSAFDELKYQCEKMLRYSPVSYVFLYSLQSGIRVVPAIDIIAADTCNPHQLSSWSMRQFFKAHFECFIGDKLFKAAEKHQLEILAKEYDCRSGLVISGSSQVNNVQPNMW